jgi:hypothetical protein
VLFRTSGFDFGIVGVGLSVLVMTLSPHRLNSCKRVELFLIFGFKIRELFSAFQMRKIRAMQGP